MAQVKKLVLLLLSPVFVRCRSNWFSIFDGFRDCSAYIPLFVCGSCRVSWLGSDSCSFCRDLLWVWIVGKSWMFGELGFVFEFVNWVFFPLLLEYRWCFGFRFWEVRQKLSSWTFCGNIWSNLSIFVRKAMEGWWGKSGKCNYGNT